MKKTQNYKTVYSLTGRKANEIYQTKKYNLFKAVKGNRGEEKGYEEKRVKELVRLIESDAYYHDLSIIVVNKNGVGIDGMNRVEALRRTGNYVIFRVVVNPEYQNEKNLLPIIARINGYNPMWSAKQQFLAALVTGNKLAHLLSYLRADVVANSVKLAENDISVNQMMTLVERNKNKTHSRKRLLSEYDNEAYLTYAQTDQFEEEFKFACKVIEYFKDSTIDACRILEQLLFLMWTTNFNKNLFYYNLLKKGFKIPVVKGNLIRAKIVELSEVKVSARVLATLN